MSDPARSRRTSSPPAAGKIDGKAADRRLLDLVAEQLRRLRPRHDQPAESRADRNRP